MKGFQVQRSYLFLFILLLNSLSCIHMNAMEAQQAKVSGLTGEQKVVLYDLLNRWHTCKHYTSEEHAVRRRIECGGVPAQIKAIQAYARTNQAPLIEQ
jgi:hypothetical protein